MRTVKLRSGERLPAFGLGTWKMAERRGARADEIAALQHGIDLGATLIDTAEMYADGKAEELVAEAIQGRREQVFIVSKVYPHNASRRGAVAACERSLKRLRTDRIDLYLLHWRGSVPLDETMAVFEELQQAGKIRHYGVSNLDLNEMQEVMVTPQGRAVEVNQVLYNLSRRGVEWDLKPWLDSHGIPIMAYSPIEQAKLLRNSKLVKLAEGVGATPAQVALAWLLRSDDVIVIPKSGDRERVKENIGALEVRLTPEHLAELDRLFPPPHGPRALEML